MSSLSEAEQRALQQALARVNIATLLPPWEPWWLTPAAAQVRLRADGTRMVALVQEPAEGALSWPPAPTLLQPPGKRPARDASGDTRDAAGSRADAAQSSGSAILSRNAAGIEAGGPHGPPDAVATVTARTADTKTRSDAEKADEAAKHRLTDPDAAARNGAAPRGPLHPGSSPPRPPDTAVPSIEQLCSGEPAPQLRFVLLQLVCAYCYTQRSYAGDVSSDPEGWLQLIWHLCPHVTAQAGAGEELPDDVTAAMLALAEQLRAPPASERRIVDVTRMLAQDCAAVLRAGRGALLCVVAEVGRLHCVVLAAQQSTKRRHRELGVRQPAIEPSADLNEAQRPFEAVDGPIEGNALQPAPHSSHQVRAATSRDRDARTPKSCVIAERERRAQLLRAVRKLVFLTSVASSQAPDVLQAQERALAAYLRDMDSMKSTVDVAVR